MQKKILIVDDSNTIRQCIRKTLEEKDYYIEEACDGEEALQIISDKSFDLIFTDINMPRMDGISFIEKARKLQTTMHTPIITLTTENTIEIITKGKNAGATGWMLKPFTTEKIIEVTQRVLS